MMASLNVTNLHVNYDELGEEFEKLASLIPTIPKDRCLSKLEFIEFVIVYIRQLQQLLSYDQWDECINKLASSTKNFLFSPSTSSSFSHLFNQLTLPSSTIQTNESSPIIRRNPLAIINLDNTQLS